MCGVILKTVLLFPGQGSHFAGMGLDLLQSRNSFFLDLVQVASDQLHFDLANQIREPNISTFTKSAYLQPLITSVSLAYWKLLCSEGFNFDIVLGHSLGEITALAGAGILSETDCVQIATFRGQVMDESADLCSGGGMAVVLFSDEQTIANAIVQYGLDNSLFIANYNAPNQTVVSGDLPSLESFSEKYTKDHPAKIQKIDVAGPWHTPFISYGREKYLQWADKKEFSSPRLQFIMNGTSDFASQNENFLLRTADQLILPVYWYQSLRKVVEHFTGARVIEVGPGKILSGLIRANKLQKSFSTIESVNSLESLDTITRELQNGN